MKKTLWDFKTLWPVLVRYFGQDRSDLFSLLAYSVLGGALSLAFPLTAQVLINTVASGAVVQSLAVLVLVLLAGLILFAWMETARFRIVEFLGRRLFVRRSQVFTQKLAFADDGVTGAQERTELANRFFDVITADKSLQVLLFDGLSAGLGVLAGMALLALYHPALLGFDLLLAAAALVPLLMTRRGVHTAYAESTAKYKVVAWLEDIAGTSTWARGQTGYALARSRMDRLVEDWLETRQAHFRVTFSQYASYLVIQAVGTVGLLGLGGFLVITEQLSLGQLVAAELVVTATVAALARLGKLLPKAYDLVVSLKKLDHVEVDLVQESRSSYRADLQQSCTVDLDNVELGVGSHLCRLQLAPGELASWRPGARNYEILEMLYGLTTPTSGSVLLNGIPLKDLSHSWLRDRIGFVDGADVVSGSVEDNLRLGKLDASVEEMWSALEDVGLKARMVGLGLGVSLEVHHLNDEERVQVALAREFLRQPALWLIRGIDVLPDLALRKVATSLMALNATRIVVTNHSNLFASPPVGHSGQEAA